MEDASYEVGIAWLAFNKETSAVFDSFSADDAAMASFRKLWIRYQDRVDVLTSLLSDSQHILDAEIVEADLQAECMKKLREMESDMTCTK